MMLPFNRLVAGVPTRRWPGCQFPLWGDEEGPADRIFCGKPLRPAAEGGGPYCAECAKRCFTGRAFVTLPPLKEYRRVAQDTDPVGIDGQRDQS